MTDGKKEPIKLVEDETPPESDPVADELVVLDLQRQIEELKQREIELEYQVGGMSDMARMNVAGSVLAALVSFKGEVPLSHSNLIRKSVEVADRLIQHYQDIIEANAVEYQKKLANLDPEEDDNGNTVN